MDTNEIINTFLALIAVTISSIALIRSRKVTKIHLNLNKKNIELNALTTLLSEYKSKLDFFEKALLDGTIERESLSHQGMESIIEEYYEKQQITLHKIENILKYIKSRATD